MEKLPEVHPAVHDAFVEGMCVVQWGDTKCYCGIVLDMVAVTHIIRPQRASIFGEYTHMQLMPCLQSYRKQGNQRWQTSPAAPPGIYRNFIWGVRTSTPVDLGNYNA